MVGVQPMDDCDHRSGCAFRYQRPEARSATPVSPHPISSQNHSCFGINVVVGDLHRAYLCCIEVLTYEPVCLLLYMGSSLGITSQEATNSSNAHSCRFDSSRCGLAFVAMPYYLKPRRVLASSGLAATRQEKKRVRLRQCFASR